MSLLIFFCLFTFQNGVIRGTLLGVRFMGKERGGRGGIVINIGSNTSMRPYVSAPIYSATKHAVLGFTRSFGVRKKKKKKL
jgi:15-hydroxyprostaglandin dehydrogenase (NAD)